MLRTSLLIIAGIAWLVLMGSMLPMMYYMARGAYSRVSDAPYRWVIHINPYTAIWFPDQLSEEGLKFRGGFKV